MPRIEVIDALTSYLQAGAANGSVPSVGTVFPYPPKITKESALYEATQPGDADGAVIYLYLSGQSEVRISSAGQHGGRKGRAYKLSLICYFRWKGPESEAAGRSANEFLDGLTAYIEADRNAGTQAVSLGGNGTGIIFSWGEGTDPSSLLGPDILVNSMMPRTVRGQMTQVFSIVEVGVIEILDT